MSDSVTVPADDKGSYTGVWSGRLIPIESPSVEDVYIEDIANSLSKSCRYNGNCMVFYSTAQHSVLGVEIALNYYDDKDLGREFLLHDAAEYLVGDMPRPYKVNIPEFSRYERLAHKAISEKYGVPYEMSDSCKHLDNIMISWEKRDIITPGQEWPGLPNIEDFNLEVIKPWDWECARDLYLFKFRQLFGDIR